MDTLHIDSKSRSLPPDWVRGFVDGEGCFYVGLSKGWRMPPVKAHAATNPKLKVGIEVRPSFSVSQGSASKDVVAKLAQYFNHGEDRLRLDRYILKYETRSTNHIRDQVIPHFDRYPLRSQKQGGFLKLRRVMEMMNRSEHLIKDGLREIISIAYSMNLDPNGQSRRNEPIEHWLEMVDGVS
jgi:hypothetical protein